MQARGGDPIRRSVTFFLFVFGGVAADQLTKYVIFDERGVGNQGREIIPGIFSLTSRMNTGTAFGLFQGRNDVFVVLTIVAIAAITIYFLKSAALQNPMAAASAALIIAGALGNLIDRILFQYVRDFIDFHIWPIFNVADALICVGAFGLVYTSLRPGDDKTAEKQVGEDERSS